MGQKEMLNLGWGPGSHSESQLGSGQSCRDLHTSAYICICLFSLSAGLVPYGFPFPLLSQAGPVPHQEPPRGHSTATELRWA